MFSEETIFSFRKHSFAESGINMIVSFRKKSQKLEKWMRDHPGGSGTCFWLGTSV
jgi:hypothetical protein